MGGLNCCSDRWCATAAFPASFSLGRIRAPAENQKDDDGPDGEARGLKRRIDDLDGLEHVMGTRRGWFGIKVVFGVEMLLGWDIMRRLTEKRSPTEARSRKSGDVAL
ncbi:hypothetical protein OROHE_008986 [Orobanche hederae]